MKKSNELLRFSYDCGYTIAHLYNIPGGYYHTKRFLYYTKKEIIALLRNKYDCVVSKDVLKHDMKVRKGV